MRVLIGQLEIHGVHIGEKMDILEYKELQLDKCAELMLLQWMEVDVKADLTLYMFVECAVYYMTTLSHFLNYPILKFE